MIKEIEEAYNRIAPHINKTPVMTSRTLNALVGAKVFLKCENFQRGGAFKARGAFNSLMLLTPEEQKRGVIAHSSGNHAQAVALASRELSIFSTIVMPKNAPLVKKEATRGYGATIVECGNNPLDRSNKTDELIERHNYTLIHPYNAMRTIHGAGTAAYELIQEVRDLDLILAPIGGGGLISGTSIAIKGFCSDVRIIGVEPSNADDAYRSLRDNKIYPSINPNTIADGLRTNLGDITFNLIKKNVDSIKTVSEKEIIEAMRFLWERLKIIVEPSGAVPLAGLLKISKEKSGFSLDGLSIGLILSGGNVDLSAYFKLLKRGLTQG
jgi:threonine dehydratase